MESNKILCFICGQKFEQSEIQNHIFKDKLKYEGQKKVRLAIPDEYNLLFKTIKGGLSLQGDDVSNFNSLIATKSVRSQSNQLEYNYGPTGNLSQSQSLPRKSPHKSPPKKTSFPPPYRIPIRDWGSRTRASRHRPIDRWGNRRYGGSLISLFSGPPDAGLRRTAANRQSVP